MLALNAGSSTLKYTLYRCDAQGDHRLFAETFAAGKAGSSASLDAAVERARATFGAEPSIVGHRIVHGGATFTKPVVIDDAVLQQLTELTPLAPLHLPPALDLVRGARARCPAALHVACFDTAFHQTLPDVAKRFALPAALYDRGIRRYGFHGLSYEYIVSTFGARLPARLIVAHLGNGASMAAIRDGRSIDTSMGFTPAGGLPMGTRSGDLDPGVMIHLLRDPGGTASDLEQLLNHRSGLLGVAGSSGMVELIARAQAGDVPARAAIDLFAYSVRKQIGAYTAVLGGLDCLVFTGGIGEHAPLVRELSCHGLAAFGIELDAARNAANADIISRDSAACRVRVVPTDEDLIIARAARTIAGEQRRR